MPTAVQLRRWLTGPSSDPSIRARFWQEVEGLPSTDPRVRSAVREIGRKGWAAGLLENQFPDGHWMTHGVTDRDLYRPKYAATNWNAIVLGELGMSRSDRRIRRTAELILNVWGRKGGPLRDDLEICVTGNAVRTLIRFGYFEHGTVQRAIRWIVRSQKPDGGWHCWTSRTGTLDGWEGLAALSYVPEDLRDASIRRAIERGAEFFLRHRLMREGKHPYPPWLRIHYPNHYYYDVLVGLGILSRLGYSSDPRMGPALRWLRSKRSQDGTWALDATHPDVDPSTRYQPLRRGPMFPMLLEAPGRPSQWATVSALSVLARAERG